MHMWALTFLVLLLCILRNNVIFLLSLQDIIQKYMEDEKDILEKEKKNNFVTSGKFEVINLLTSF